MWWKPAPARTDDCEIDPEETAIASAWPDSARLESLVDENCTPMKGVMKVSDDFRATTVPKRPHTP